MARGALGQKVGRCIYISVRIKALITPTHLFVELCQTII
jgi:hypothetical protein